ncbi:hypothetical protein ACFLYI_02830 [Chloroflexota bacterium]
MTIKMKCFVIYLPLMIIVLALSGCGIPQMQYDQLKSELTYSQQQLEELGIKVEDLTKANIALEDLVNNDTKLNEELNTRVEDLIRAKAALEDSANDSAKLNEELSTIAAYSIWYDYYYGTGTYSFDNVTVFNSQLGSFIAAIGDTNSRAAFDVYYATHYYYSTLVASLPEDNIWTQSQYESWRDADESLYEALGQVGGHLLIKMESIPWFGKE